MDFREEKMTEREQKLLQALLDIIEICEHMASTKLDSVYKIAKEAIDDN